MEIRTTEEARKNIEDFTLRHINLLLEKKRIDADIKALKQEYKEEGVPTAVLIRAFNEIKSDKKRTETEKFEFDVIKGYLEDNKDIDDGICALNEA